MLASSRHVIARHVTVEGRVQGVAFRWATRDKAEELGVTGWVRNRMDGSVEAHCEGLETAIEPMLAWLHEGPRMARVTSVQANGAPVEGAATFEIRETAL